MGIIGHHITEHAPVQAPAQVAQEQLSEQQRSIALRNVIMGVSMQTATRIQEALRDGLAGTTVIRGIARDLGGRVRIDLLNLLPPRFRNI